MASVKGTFAASGESSELSGVTGNLDFSVHYAGGAKGTVKIEVSLDSGTTWFHLDGSGLTQRSKDMIVVAGSSELYYKVVATGVSGTIHYFLGVS